MWIVNTLIVRMLTRCTNPTCLLGTSQHLHGGGLFYATKCFEFIWFCIAPFRFSIPKYCNNCASHIFAVFFFIVANNTHRLTLLQGILNFWSKCTICIPNTIYIYFLPGIEIHFLRSKESFIVLTIVCSIRFAIYLYCKHLFMWLYWKALPFYIHIEWLRFIHSCSTVALLVYLSKIYWWLHGCMYRIAVIAVVVAVHLCSILLMLKSESHKPYDCAQTNIHRIFSDPSQLALVVAWKTCSTKIFIELHSMHLKQEATWLWGSCCSINVIEIVCWPDYVCVLVDVCIYWDYGGNLHVNAVVKDYYKMRMHKNELVTCNE